MAWGLVALGTSAASAVIGGVVSSKASKKAAQAQVQAAQEANASNERIFNQQVALNAPFRDASLQNQSRLQDLLGTSGNTGNANYGQYGSADPGENWMKLQDPGYNFRLSEGLKAFDHSAAARGGTLSGNILKGREQYAQNLASDEYNNAFNRYQTIRNNTLAPLQQSVSTGLAATGSDVNAASNYGQLANENITGMGNARASGYIGQANAVNSALSGVANAGTGYLNYNMFNKMLSQPSGYGGSIEYPSQRSGGYTGGNPNGYYLGGPYSSGIGMQSVVPDRPIY
jgi:hypothetical protein